MPFGIGTGEMLFFGIIALLLFGKRLPEVARSLGKGVTEFKKGISGVEDDIKGASYTPARERSRPVPADEEASAVTAPKFQPPTSAPTEAEKQEQPV